MPTLTVSIKPNASKTCILTNEPLRIAIAAPAENNRANQELEKFLTRQYGKRARIISGFTSRRKLVRLE